MTDSSLLPNLIIGGVFKSATTSLFTYLTMHPDICGSAKKETSFFTKLAEDAKPPPIESYLDYFSTCKEARYRLEASPDYFYGGRKVATIMRDKLPKDTRIIFVFREPVERFISHFKHEKKFLYLPQNTNIDAYVQQWQNTPTYEDIFFPLEASFYNRFLQDWFDIFGDKIKIIFFEQIRDSRDELLQELAEWLSIDPSLFVFDDMIVENQTVGYRNPVLQWIALTINRQGEIFWRRNPKLKRKLKDLYFSLNGANNTDELSDEQANTLRQAFSQSNSDLCHLLKQQGYVNFPPWLASE
jgi:hypothetical protein